MAENIVDPFLQRHSRAIINAAMRTPAGRSELAIQKSGTSDKRTKEYKSARRSFERYVTEAKEKRRPKVEFKPDAEGLRRLAAIADKKAFPADIKVRLVGYITVSDDRRTRGVNLKLNSQAEVAEFVKISIEDEQAGALYIMGKDGFDYDGINTLAIEDFTADIR